MTSVAILGCGPAGLLVAHRARQMGLRPVIFSEPVKSFISGAQFLHEPIPGLSQPSESMPIQFIKQGDRPGYAQKVYDRPDAPCSWEEYPEGPHEAWALAPAYDRLWEEYGKRVNPVEFRPDGSAIEIIKKHFRPIISTIPVTALCSNPSHSFTQAAVWIRSHPVTWRTRTHEDFIEYNGDPMIPYYRASKIGGQYSWEFGHEVGGAVYGRKPLATTCDCHPGIERLGRFGKWKKGVLLHHVYNEAKEAIHRAYAL